MMVRRILTEWFVLLLCLAGLAVLAARFELTNPVDARLLDRAASAARADVSDDILIVAIDDASLAELGPWPWPRSTHARLLDAIAEMDSGIVLYDVLFLEPTQPEEDAALGNAVSRHGNVILPFTFLRRINTQDGIVPAYPIDSIAHGVAGLGHVTITPDADGVLRRFNFDLTIDGQNYPHFVEAALGVDEGSALDLPAEPLIAFHPVNSYARIPAADVIAGRVPQEFLQGKTVLVGATAQGMGDRYSVGAREVAVMPGVETQANLLDAAAFRLAGGCTKQLVVCGFGCARTRTAILGVLETVPTRRLDRHGCDLPFDHRSCNRINSARRHLDCARRGIARRPPRIPVLELASPDIGQRLPGRRGGILATGGCAKGEGRRV